MEDSDKRDGSQMRQTFRASWTLRLTLLGATALFGALVVGPSLNPVFEGVNGAGAAALPRTCSLAVLSTGTGALAALP